MPTHKVKQGEDIISIAADYGFDPDFIWEMDENEDLREKRKTPNILKENDEVFVPKPRPKEEKVQTGTRHTFQIQRPTTVVQLELRDEDDQLHANAPFILKVTLKSGDEFEPIEGKTNSQGVLEAEIPAESTEGEIVLYPATENEYFIPFQLGTVDPVDEGFSGIQSMLNNLGYECGKEDDAMDELTRSAVRDFQTDYGLEPLESDADKIDDDTRDAIISAFLGLH